MSCDTVRSLIEGHLHDNWSTTDIAYQNVSYKPTIGTPFIQCNIMPAFGSQKDIGSLNNLFEFVGIISIGIFTPKDEGTKTGYDLATLLQTLFLRYDTGGLQCKIGHVKIVGENESWWHVNITIPYTFDEIL